MFGNFEDVAFDDSSDAIQVRAPPAFHIVLIFRRAMKSEKHTGAGQHGQTSERNQIAPISKKLVQRLYSLEEMINRRGSKNESLRVRRIQ